MVVVDNETTTVYGRSISYNGGRQSRRCSPTVTELIANSAAGSHRQNCESIAMGLGFSLMGSTIPYL